jgi:hypothetical protein
MVERGARGRAAQVAARAGDQLTPGQRERRRLWIVLVGAIIMAVAGALLGAGVRLDDLVYPDLRGPRLRVSPAAALNPSTLSRESPPPAGRA